MKPTHHPTTETLMRYAAGTLPAGPAIVVAAHVAECPVCRAEVRALEAAGGALLDAMEPTPLAPSALADVLARIDAETDVPAPDRPSAEAPPRIAPPHIAPPHIDGIELPASLSGCKVGRWRWIGPGMRMSRVDVPQDPDANLILLKVGGGRALPDHGHEGTEFTYIVSGSYTDRLGQFRPGDIAEVDDDIEHQPIVDAGRECICLAAIDGRMRFNSRIGRLLQPIFGI